MKDCKSFAGILSLVLFFLANFKFSICSKFYDITAKDIYGRDVLMGDHFRGKVVLIVNVASECGYTDLHYKQLVDLQSRFSVDHFVILAFPCNQFGSQEPNRNSAIHRFVRKKYKVQFRMFSKINVIGEQAHPLYKFLESQTRRSPTWNFNKYLIDREGNVEKYWDHTVPPLDCLKKIKKLLNFAVYNSETLRVDAGEL
ncbi:glutathione peroxidase 7-like [Actinia tenebrosa]|uniref:Glutathione peroxidase n=1 Tax=Actinia tenebrosa TaxID=6105 RepID=A0A6P8IFC4_ACTTE|nr:glutathione peroxidase 7-like [Actinia tenebrosa]